MTARDGVCVGCGTGAVAARVGTCTAADVGGRRHGRGGGVETAPVSRVTYSSVTLA